MKYIAIALLSSTCAWSLFCLADFLRPTVHVYFLDMWYVAVMSSLLTLALPKLWESIFNANRMTADSPVDSRTQEEILLAAMKEIEDCPVRGHIRKLDDTRLVFLGQNPKTPNEWCLGFRNAEGEDTLLKISQEAFDALKWLCGESFKGERVKFPYVLRTRWTVTLQQPEPTPHASPRTPYTCH